MTTGTQLRLAYPQLQQDLVYRIAVVGIVATSSREVRDDLIWEALEGSGNVPGETVTFFWLSYCVLWKLIHFTRSVLVPEPRAPSMTSGLFLLN